MCVLLCQPGARSQPNRTSYLAMRSDQLAWLLPWLVEVASNLHYLHLCGLSECFVEAVASIPRPSVRPSVSFRAHVLWFLGCCMLPDSLLLLLLLSPSPPLGLNACLWESKHWHDILVWLAIHTQKPGYENHTEYRNKYHLNRVSWFHGKIDRDHLSLQISLFETLYPETNW